MAPWFLIALRAPDYIINSCLIALFWFFQANLMISGVFVDLFYSFDFFVFDFWFCSFSDKMLFFLVFFV